MTATTISRYSPGPGARVRAGTAVWLHVVAPVLLGAAIYLLFRTRTLLVFAWADAVGAGAALDAARGHTLGWARSLGGAVLFSLPDALWVYALTAAMLRVWRGSASPARWPWIACGVLLGAGGELGQLAGFVPGTFDLLDLSLSVAAFGAALAFTPTGSSR